VLLPTLPFCIENAAHSDAAKKAVNAFTKNRAMVQIIFLSFCLAYMSNRAYDVICSVMEER
jgi:hypothetical protein